MPDYNTNVSVIGVDPGQTCGAVTLDADGTLILQQEMTALGAVRFVEDNARPGVRIACLLYTSPSPRD